MLDTGLRFCNTLGDSKFKVIDIELILKPLVMNMFIEYGHSCMKFSICGASRPTPPPPHQTQGPKNIYRIFTIL